MLSRAVVLFLLLLCLVLAALVLSGAAGGVLGGAATRRRTAAPELSPNIVVDTLNLTRWFEPATSPESIIRCIDRTAAPLKKRHPGRVMYVVKDRDSMFNDDAAREMYKAASVRNGVYVYVVERYRDPPAVSKQIIDSAAEHSAGGRDDFYMALLAAKWKCAALSEDRLRDFDRFRATIRPFRVYEYNPWRDLPIEDFVRPDAAAHRRLRRPKMVRPHDYFPPRVDADVT